MKEERNEEEKERRQEKNEKREDKKKECTCKKSTPQFHFGRFCTSFNLLDCRSCEPLLCTTKNVYDQKCHSFDICSLKEEKKSSLFLEIVFSHVGLKAFAVLFYQENQPIILNGIHI